MLACFQTRPRLSIMYAVVIYYIHAVNPLSNRLAEQGDSLKKIIYEYNSWYISYVNPLMSELFFFVVFRDLTLDRLFSSTDS